jgi:hypothetical protein
MSEKGTKASIVDHSSKSFGKNPYFISDTAAHTGLTGYMFKAIEDTVVAAISSNVGGNTLVAETIVAGDTWYMDFTSITLTSGAGFVYNYNVVG